MEGLAGPYNMTNACQQAEDAASLNQLFRGLLRARMLVDCPLLSLDVALRSGNLTHYLSESFIEAWLNGAYSHFTRVYVLNHCRATPGSILSRIICICSAKDIEIVKAVPASLLSTKV
jgi:hypothetical protein